MHGISLSLSLSLRRVRGHWRHRRDGGPCFGLVCANVGLGDMSVRCMRCGRSEFGSGVQTHGIRQCILGGQQGELISSGPPTL